MLLINGDPTKDIKLLTDPQRNFLLIIKNGGIYIGSEEFLYYRNGFVGTHSLEPIIFATRLHCQDGASPERGRSDHHSRVNRKSLSLAMVGGWPNRYRSSCGGLILYRRLYIALMTKVHYGSRPQVIVRRDLALRQAHPQRVAEATGG